MNKEDIVKANKCAELALLEWYLEAKLNTEEYRDAVDCIATLKLYINKKN